MWLITSAGVANASSYDLTVSPVHETCVEGSASPSWAESVLAAEGLRPAQVDDRAQVKLCGTTARFGHRTFSEGTLSVVVDDGSAFLVGALQTIGMYAWVERTRNKSPYVHGDVDEAHDATGVHLVWRVHGNEVLSATGAPVDGPTVDEVFEGPIHQPGGTCFDARLAAARQRRAFDAATDVVVFGEGPLADVLRSADFTPTGWVVAADGVHAKNKTRSCP